MTATDRTQREQCFHDEQAAARARTFAADPGRLRFADDQYLDHETWIRPAIAQLAPLRGRSLLDWGCGHGMAAVVFARNGANVTACDLSAGYVRETRARAAANSATVRCVQADAHRLPFSPATFDGVWGHAVLHHLDVAAAVSELRRILRPNGVGVLCEPWGGNPLLRVARRWLPGRTADEEPLREEHIRILRSVFATVDIRGFQLMTMLRRVVPQRRWMSSLERGDERLLKRWPALGRFGRYVMIVVRP